MGTTSSFFGGGGGGAVLDAPNQGFVKNIDFATNTQFAVSSNRGQSPRVVPCKSNTFFLLEGNSTSKVHASYWSLSDSGAATQEATAIQVNSNASEVSSATSNGVDRLMTFAIAGSDGFLNSIYYNGSSLSSSQIQSTANIKSSTSTVTCTVDGVLMGTATTTNSGLDTLSCRVGVIFPDGTTMIATKSQDMYQNQSRLIGTGEGLIGFGRRGAGTDEARGVKIFLKPTTGSNLLEIADAGHTVNVTASSLALSIPPYIMPTNGGTVGAMIGDLRRIHNFSQTSYGDVVTLHLRESNRPSSQGSDVGNEGMFGEALGQDSTFSRQANGTYQHYNSGNFSHYVTFNPEGLSHHAPFGAIRPVGDAGSSGCESKISTAIVGNFVIATWYDETDGDVNIDAWNFKG